MAAPPASATTVQEWYMLAYGAGARVQHTPKTEREELFGGRQ